ncbi:MAG: hypothetical protein LBT82_03555 [Oscillospiraceae bacterium]|jgi:hypothetical protein|nr:hypothetical protein [Oscillospiraceae bacterium]
MRFLFFKKNRTLQILCCLFFLVFLLVFYQVFFLIYPSIKTEIAVLATIEDNVDAYGYIIKKETVVSSDDVNKGVMIFELKNGQRVSKGGLIASVYNTVEDAIAKKKIKDINIEIEKLKLFNKSKISFASDPNEVSKQIFNVIRFISNDVDNFRHQEITFKKEALIEFLNERQIILGKTQNFNDRILELKKRRQTLKDSCKEAVKACIRSTEAGSFIDHLDGYENVFNFESIAFLTPEDLNSVTPQNKFNSKNIIGKIVDDLSWYIAFNINSDDVTKFAAGMNFNILIPMITSQKIPVEVVSINQKDKNSLATIVCSCDYMNTELINLRQEKLSICLNSYSGIKIPKIALHKEVARKQENCKEVSKKATGVFTLRGNELIFKEVVITYVGHDYVICNQNPDPKDVSLENTIKAYDKIVTEGCDLWDGKIIK